MNARALILVVALAPCLALADEHPVHEGKWEVTSTITMPGMPAMPGQTHTQCITKADPIPKHDSPHAQNCQVLEKNITGGTVTWKIRCEGKSGPIEGDGRITYAAGTFDGTMVMKMANPRGGTPVEVTTNMKGTRVGDCDAK